MSYSALQSRIADELGQRTDLTSQIQLEIASSIEWYQYESFPWTEASTAIFYTVQGQRYYPQPANFLRVMDVLSQIGNYTYKLHAETEQYIDRIDWGNTFWTSYPILYSLWENQIRLFPPPQANLPVQMKGIISQLPLMTASGTWTANTVWTVGQTIQDSNGNVEQCSQGGMGGSTAPFWPTSSTPTSGIGSAPVPYSVGTVTTDNAAKWTLIGTTSNVWTTQAEELIRTRTLKNIYARYIRDMDMAQAMEMLEMKALSNMQQKNVGRTALGRIRSHF